MAETTLIEVEWPIIRRRGESESSVHFQMIRWPLSDPKQLFLIYSTSSKIPVIMVDLLDKNLMEVIRLEGGDGPQMTTGIMRPVFAGGGGVSAVILKRSK